MRGSQTIAKTRIMRGVKSFGIFFTVLALITVLCGGVVWWLGPALVNLALLDPQRDQPFTLLDFSRGENAEVLNARYHLPLNGLLTSEGGVVIDGFHASHLLMGERRNEWRYLQLMQMNRAADLVQVLTASPYRLMFEVLPEVEHQMLGSYQVPLPNWRDTLVVWLIRLPEHAGLGNDPLAPVLAQLAAASGSRAGRVIWDTPARMLEQHMIGEAVTRQNVGWDRLLVMDFPDLESAMSWLRLPDVATARALSNARVRDLAVSIYERDQSRTQ